MKCENCMEIQKLLEAMDRIEELQKMQQPKVCKWKPKEEKKWFFYATECGKDYEEWDSDTINTLNFCPNCGGKIEIDKGNVQK